MNQHEETATEPFSIQRSSFPNSEEPGPQPKIDRNTYLRLPVLQKSVPSPSHSTCHSEALSLPLPHLTIA